MPPYVFSKKVHMNIKDLFHYHKAKADSCYDPSFFEKKRVLAYAARANITIENVQLLTQFLDYADDKILRFMWQFYYLLFYTDEDFTMNQAIVETIPLTAPSESEFPGCINSVVYLMAVDNLEKWVYDKDLNKREIIESYFERYRNLAELNRISHNTSGFCRLSSFLYCYAKPSILRVGRLNFQFFKHLDYCEMYENDIGNRIFVALPNYTYNKFGLQDENGFIPVYHKDNDILTAHLYGEKGRLLLEPQQIDTAHLKLMLKPGDNVITIHIPGGSKLYVDDVLESIRSANKLFTRYFPPFKTFVCQTWFIDPALRDDVVKDGSNIASFADLFDIICGSDNDNHSIFEHVFQVKRQPLENLKPRNEFQRRILERAISGKKLYWSYGVLKKQYCDEL